MYTCAQHVYNKQVFTLWTNIAFLSFFLLKHQLQRRVLQGRRRLSVLPTARFYSIDLLLEHGKARGYRMPPQQWAPANHGESVCWFVLSVCRVGILNIGSQLQKRKSPVSCSPLRWQRLSCECNSRYLYCASLSCTQRQVTE